MHCSDRFHQVASIPNLSTAADTLPAFLKENEHTFGNIQFTPFLNFNRFLIE